MKKYGPATSFQNEPSSEVRRFRAAVVRNREKDGLRTVGVKAMKMLKYIMCTVATLCMLVVTTDSYAQRRGGGRGNDRGGGRPAPQFNPAPQMRPAQPQVREPRPAASGNAGANASGGVRVGEGNVRVRTDGSAGANAGVRVNDGNPRVRTDGSAGANAGVRVTDGSARVRTDGSARTNAAAGANAPYGVRRAGAEFPDSMNRANQAIYRNSVNIGQRSYNLAPNSYRGSYQNYPWHRGYWNNYYGWNPQIGYGRGFGGYGNYGGYGIRIGNFAIGTGGYGGYGGYGYGRYPMGWGYGGWGLGNVVYNSGYMPYMNPYWGGGANYVYNYAQPIPVVVNSSPSDIAARDFDSAREAFRAGDYETALSLTDRAIKAQPSDEVLHEFRALTLFAMKDYSAAAATIHSVLAVGPGWDWATMAALYPEVEVYTGQLRALENHAKAHADEPAPQFLLGYHYMTTGHPDAAARKFAQVVKLEPKDRVARDLLALVDKPKDGDVVESTPPAPREETAPVSKPDETTRPIDATAIAGHWQASRDDGSKFDLDLRKDKTFTWRFAQDSRNEEFSGTYSTEGSLLILQKEGGGAMVGHVTQDADGKFNFKLLGAPSDDPGLTFTR